jgi:CrcB protein
MIWLLVAIGGALGSVARHGLNQVVHQRALGSTFPLGVFLINIGGSIVIGLIAGALASDRLQWSLQTRTFVIVGLLGGFTTFSSFSLDTLALVRDGHSTQALVNVVGQVSLSLIGVWLGFRVGASL